MNVRDAHFLVFDTETTDRDPKVARLIEVAAASYSMGHGLGVAFSHLCDPGVPIPPSASAIHHITDEHIPTGSQSAETIIEMLQRHRQIADCMVAHNAEYDSTVLRLVEHPWLCPHRLSKHLWPEIGNHSNQEIRYTLKLKPNLDPDAPAHRAANDVAVTLAILAHALPVALAKWPDVVTVNQLIAKVNAPCLLHRIPFAGHGYPLFTEAEAGLLEWIINKGAGGEDCVHTAREELKRRYSSCYGDPGGLDEDDPFGDD